MNRSSHDEGTGFQCGQMTRCPCGRLLNVQCDHVYGCPVRQGYTAQYGPSATYHGNHVGHNCHRTSGPGRSWTGADVAGCHVGQSANWTTSHVVGCPESQRNNSTIPVGSEVGFAGGQMVICPCGQVIGQFSASVLKGPNGQADNGHRMNSCPCGQPMSSLSSHKRNSHAVVKGNGKHCTLPGTCNIIYGKSLVPVKCRETLNAPTDEETDIENEDILEDEVPCIKGKTSFSSSRRSCVCRDSELRGNVESSVHTGGRQLERLYPRKLFRGCQPYNAGLSRNGDGVLLYCMPVDASGIFTSDDQHVHKSSQEVTHKSKESVNVSNPGAVIADDKNCPTIVYKTVYKTQAEDPFPAKIAIANNRKEPEKCSTYVEANIMDYQTKMDPNRGMSITESVQTDRVDFKGMNASWSERPSVESDLFLWDRRNS